MKEYRFEEISLGLSESFQVEITREMMDKFRDISGCNLTEYMTKRTF